MEKQICKKCFTVSDEEGHIDHQPWCPENQRDFTDFFKDMLKQDDKSK